MGQQVSVETLTSSSDTDGKKYWASFDPYPFKVGSRKLVYLGILNGDGPMKGQKCVVKTPRRDSINRQDWMLEKKRTKVVREVALAYNKAVSDRERKVCINGPIIAEIDTLSDCMCLNDLIGKPRKKFKEADFVSIELYLKGRFEDFEYGWVDEKDLIVPEAFSHYSWCHSEGTFLVSNLQGVKSSEAYHFTGPVIHSDNKSFGSSDIGPEGIKGFFKLHKCNEVCRNWPRLGDGINLRDWRQLPSRVGAVRRPSAPPSPVLPPYQHTDAYSNIAQQHGQISLPQYASPCQRSMSPCQPCPSPCQPSMSPCQPSLSPCSSGLCRPLADRGQNGMVIDWREEMMYQNMVLGQGQGQGQGRSCGPAFHNTMFDTQFMWVVKQMSYAFYNAPPPYSSPSPPYSLPYDVGSLPYDVGAQTPAQQVETVEDLDLYADDDDDSRCLLPPPYTEQSVEPEYDQVTYL